MATNLYLTPAQIRLFLLDRTAGDNFLLDDIAARKLLSRPPHRKRSERGRASGSEGVWGERGAKRG
jgi:hypothetical protein